MKISKNKLGGTVKVFPKYKSAMAEINSKSTITCPGVLGASCFDIFFYAKSQIDIFDSDGNILLSNSLDIEFEENYNIKSDLRLDYIDIDDKFKEALGGNVVELPAIEFFINANNTIWREIKLVPLMEEKETLVVCISTNVSKFKHKEFEYLKLLANSTKKPINKQLSFVSDQIAFLTYFIKMLPQEIAIYSEDKKLLCSNFKIPERVFEDTFVSKLAPKCNNMQPFEYLGNKLYVKIEEPSQFEMNSHKDIICVTDIEGKILDISDSVKFSFGESKENLLGDNITKFYQYPEDRETLVQKVLKEKSISDYALTFRNSKGIVSRHKTNTKLVDDYSRPVLVSSISVEDSSLAKVEHIYRNEEVLQETQRLSCTGSWFYDITTESFKYSDETKRIFDVDIPQIGFKQFIKTIVPNDKFKTLRFFSRVKNNETLQTLECKVVTGKGNTKVLHIEGKLERDYSGNPKRIVGFTQDITKLRITEKAFQAKQNEIDSLYQSIPAMLITTDSNYVIKTVSKFLLDTLGYQEEDILGKNLQEFIFSESNALQLEQVNKLKNLDVDAIDHGGNLLHVRMNIAAKQNLSEDTGYNIVLVDITDKELMHRDLQYKTEELETKVETKTNKLKQTISSLQDENIRNQKLRAQLVKAQLEVSKSLESEQESGELKSRFIDMISHEYRTPLTVIMSSAYIIERLANMSDDAKLGKHIDKILKASNAMTGLLDNTLDMVFHNKGDYTFVPSLFNLENCIEKVAKEIEIIDGYNHKIKYINTIEDPTLYTDLRLTRLSVYNLVLNAVKYSPKDSKVIIKSEELEGTIIIAVQDFGCGIPDCEQEMIFAPFYRGNQTGGLVPGTGLGLTVTKNCVSKINGELSFETEEGKGSTFYCKFPKRYLLRTK